MDSIIYYKYNSNKKEQNIDKDNKTDYCFILLVILEMLGIFIGIYFLTKCNHNFVFNLILFLFSPWLFVIYNCCLNSCK